MADPLHLQEWLHWTEWRFDARRCSEGSDETGLCPESAQFDWSEKNEKIAFYFKICDEKEGFNTGPDTHNIG